LNPAEVTSA